MKVQIAQTEAEIAQCFSVIVQLRPHLTRDSFVAQVLRQQKEGYQLAFIETEGTVRAVAGYRLMEMLSRGRFVYVDDLVTDSQARSAGYGKALLDWLMVYAKAQDCQLLDLDSGVQRFEAHHFYFRERMHIVAYHFARPVE